MGKPGPGDFESIWKDEYKMFNLGKNDDHTKGYFEIDYEDGIMITKGVVATIKQEIGYIFDSQEYGYIFSISSECIDDYNKGLKNKDVIPLSDLVLLQVKLDSYNFSPKDASIFLTVTGVYDINNGDFPTDYLYSDTRGKSRLVD